MKKIISILLVAMLVIGMFPATALTASATGTYEKATSIAAGDTVILVCESKAMEMSEIGIAKYGKGEAYTGTPTGLIPLTVEEGDSAGTYSFLAPAGTYLYWTSGNYLQLNGTKSANTSWTVTFSDGNAVIKNAKDSTRQIQWNASSPRFAAYTSTQTAIQLYKLSTGGSTEPENPDVPDVPTCEHTETIAIGEAKDATCTEAGTTAGEKCASCGETITAQEEIPALGHDYVDGVCSRCGEEEPEGFTLVTDASNLKAGDQIVIVAKDYAYAISTEQKTNNRGQAAVSKSGAVVTFGNDVQVLTLEAGTTSGTFAFNTGSGYLYAASSSSNHLKTESTLSANSSWAITIAADGTATIIAQGENSRNTLQYNQSSSLFACYASATQKALTIYAMSAGGGSTECEHEAGTPVKENEVAATCTKEGSYVNVTSCTKCGAVINRETVTLPMLEHTYENDACTSCGKVNPNAETKAELMTTIPGNTDKVIIYYEASNVALGVAAKSDDLVGVSTTPADTQLPYNTSVAILTVGVVDGNYVFATAEGKYLSTTGNNTLCFVDTVDANSYWTIIETDGKFVIENTAATYTDGTALALEYYNGAFTTYKTNTTEAYQMSFYLVEKGDDSCKHTNTESIPAVEPNCTETGLTEGEICSDCGVTIVFQTEVPALGHNYVDGTCSRCGDEKVMGNYTRMNSLDEVLSGGQFVILAEVDGVYYALDTQTTGKFAAVQVEVSNNTIISAAPVWTVAASNGNITLSTDGKYLGYSSSTNFATVDAYEWIVTAADNGTFNFTASTDDNRGIFYRTGTTNKYGAYAVSNANQTEYHWDLQVYKFVQPVVAADGTGYNSIDKALAAGKNNLKLFTNVTASTAFDGDLYLDLNGFNATVNATKIYAYDSSATAAKAGTGSLTSTSEVVMDNTVNGKRYIALEESENTYTFHVLEMGLTYVTLRTTKAGLYYKAKVTCDEKLAASIDSYGVALSLYNMPGADFATEYANNGEKNAWTVNQGQVVSGKEFTSGSVWGILKDGNDQNDARGKLSIYANAYIMIDGVAHMASDENNSNGTVQSLYSVMQKLDAQYSTLGDKQQAVKDFYTTWRDVMSGWNLTNLENAVSAA